MSKFWEDVYNEVVFELTVRDLRPVKKGEYHVVAKCPVHGGDDYDSLDVRISEETGKLLIHCHSRGCSYSDVMLALGIDTDKYDKSDFQEVDEEKVEYIYTDEDGNPVFAQVRIGYGRKKRFYRMWYKDGTWIKKSPPPEMLVLYNLPAVVDAVKSGETVWVVEGERDVATLTERGLCATTFAGGSTGWKKQYAEVFRGADVVIVPDTDEPGQKMASTVENGLRRIADRVRVVSLPYDITEKNGKDITDFFNDGHTFDELMRLVEASWRVDGVAYAHEWAEQADDLPMLMDYGIPGLGPDWGDTGIGPGVFIVVSARLGVGKTAWLVNLVANSALAGKTVLVSTMDEPAIRLSRYIAASLTGDGRYALPNNKKNSSKILKASGCEVLKNSSIILDNKQRTVERMIEIAARIRPDVLVVDHLACIEKSDKRDGQRAMLENAVVKLRAAASSLNCAVVAASQLNRAVEESTGIATSAALYGSDAIGHNADAVITMQKLDPNEDDNSSIFSRAAMEQIRKLESVRDDYRIMSIVKNRLGRAGTTMPVVLCGLERRVFPLHQQSCLCDKCSEYYTIVERRRKYGL